MLGADPEHRSRQIDLEAARAGPELYLTFTVVGVALRMQDMDLREHLTLLGANAAAMLLAGAVRGWYTDNWANMPMRRNVMFSIWAGFALMELVIRTRIRPYWLRVRLRRPVAV